MSGNMQPGTLYDRINIEGNFAIRLIPESPYIRSGSYLRRLDAPTFFGDQGEDISQRLKSETPVLGPQQSVEVAFSFRADQPAFTAEVKFREKGTERWLIKGQVEPGSIIESLISYKNVGSVNQAKVLAILNASGVEAVPGETYYANSRVPDGMKAGSGEDVTKGINMGDYSPGGDFSVKSEWKVTGPPCGTIKLEAELITGNGKKTPEIILPIAGSNC
ncbi:hypothetical protein [Dietzia maris]|uniref:hypothetical protein n=1 Tax=Dietzia maris TaxID=37915 RepID=UPI0023311D1E|nr:hypothetical protein [Dietzia maris]